MMERRKSTTRPCWSVRRPSSKTWRNRSQTCSDAFSNSSRRITQNGSFRTDAIKHGAGRLRSRRGEQAVEGVRRLELAHVQPDHPARGPEHELGQRLRDLGLARACRPDEEEHAERACRVGQAGLHDRDALDEALDGLRLAEHPRVEEAADLGQVEPLPRIEQREGEAGRARQGGKDIRGVDAPVSALGGLRGGERRQLEQVARSGERRQELLRQLVGLGERAVGRLDVDLVVLERVVRTRDRLRLVEGTDVDNVEGGCDPGAVGQHDLERSRVGLRHERELAGLDEGQQRVQHALRAPGMLAGVERLLERGKEPDDVAILQLLGDLLDLALELADVDRARVDGGGPGLEHGDVVREALERGPGERGLADAGRADAGAPIAEVSGRASPRSARVAPDAAP